jgi:dTDP-glucose 4,6-dehydratase
MKLLVTGGCGFIGSNFLKHVIDKDEVEFVVNLDSLTYAANIDYVSSLLTHRKYVQELGKDICSIVDIPNILEKYEIDSVVNFAAETHVDNSIKDPLVFVYTNVCGTVNLLNYCKQYWNGKTNTKFVHVSTDEVYGSLNNMTDEFTLDTPYQPNSPYSATKASSDLLCRAYNKTYNFPVSVTNCCNNYGPHQHSEKLIPLTISRLKKREKIPVYGTGQNVREWIYVDDHCEAVWQVLKNGKNGQQYLIGSGFEMSNLELVQTICDLYDKITGSTNSRELISFVTDRPGHDFRYSIDSSKIQTDLGWVAKVNFDEGLEKTIRWYLTH